MPRRLSRLAAAGRRFLVFSAPVPDLRGLGLTPAEEDVCRSLLEGCSYDEIATRRGSTVRTVANQARSVLEKVGAPDRPALVAKLYRERRSPSS